MGSGHGAREQSAQRRFELFAARREDGEPGVVVEAQLVPDRGGIAALVALEQHDVEQAEPWAASYPVETPP